MVIILDDSLCRILVSRRAAEPQRVQLKVESIESTKVGKYKNLK